MKAAISIAKKTEKTYWNAFRQGDKQAFEELYKRYFQLLFDYGVRHTQEKDATIDCLQDFFLYLWNNKQNLGEAKSVKFYLISSFRRRLFRYLAKEKKVRHEKDSFSVLQDHEECCKETQMIWEEENVNRISKVKTLFNKLSPRQKEVLYLKYYQELSPKEISETIGVKYQSVLNHLSEGMKVMRKHPEFLKAKVAV